MKFNDTYDVAIDGTVTNTKTGRVLKTCVAAGGYKQLRLGAGNRYAIHRLVAFVWLPAPTAEGCVVDHIDRNRQNNHASNLRWVSLSENALNRTLETKARKSSKLGHHHIKIIKGLRQINPTYVVVFNTDTLKHYSSHKTLDEAIAKRNSVIGQNVSPTESPKARSILGC
jgi:hypothetical protein